MSLLSELVPVRGGSGPTGTPQYRFEIQTAVAGQTQFTLSSIRYIPGYQDLRIVINGTGQNSERAVYTENSPTQITFTEPLNVNDSVLFSTIRME